MFTVDVKQQQLFHGYVLAIRLCVPSPLLLEEYWQTCRRPGRNNSLYAPSCLSSCSYLTFRAAAPVRPAATFLSFAFSVPLSTGLCRLPSLHCLSALCHLLDFRHPLFTDDCRALLSKMSVLNRGQRCRQRC